MGIFDGNMPYTNLHELNLDWVIAKIKKVDEQINNLDESIRQVLTEMINDGTLTISLENLYNSDTEELIIQLRGE